MTPQEKTILETVLAELLHIKQGMPNGELKQITDTVKELKGDLSELKYTLLNPEHGVIVKVNRNTEFRKAKEARQTEYDKYVKDLTELKSWKNTVTRALWIVFTALSAVIIKLFFTTTGIEL